MKLRHHFLLYALLPSVVIAQDTSSTSGISNMLGKRNGIRVGASIGTRFLPGSGGSVLVRYVDQSPSRDRLEQFLDIPTLKTAVAYQLVAEGVYERVFLQAGIDGFFGKFRAAAPFVGIGYTPFRFKGWDVRASARLTYGGGRYILGDVENNSVYFQIKDIRIHDSYLRMTYRDQYIGVIPTIGLEKQLGEHWSVHASANLFITVRHNTRVEFYGHDGQGKKGSGMGSSDASGKRPTVDVGLDEVDLDFIRNGEVIDKLPLYYTGVSFLAGVKYLF